MLSAKVLHRPAAITAQEITDKLAHLREMLTAEKKKGILLTAEGALRWLTGTRHQVTDIAPDAASPVSALCVLRDRQSTEITFIAAPWENPRLKAEMPPVFKGVKNVKISVVPAMPAIPAGVMLPGNAAYNIMLGKIIRPLVGGFTGNQYKKYAWLAAMMNKVVTETATQLKVGMNGPDVRALLFRNFAEHGMETNMILLCLKGQQTHLHPLYGEQYKVAPNCIMKLVTAGRFADAIVSESLLVKIGKLTNKELAVYQALQAATVEYADLYRAGALEKDIYAECGKRFGKIAKEYGIKGFGKSAYLHHLGGPTSPLGNRDFCLCKDGKNRCFSGMSFAVNPCDALGCGLKIEVQGIVSADGAPKMLDISAMTDPKLMTFSKVVSAGGTVCNVPDIMVL